MRTKKIHTTRAEHIEELRGTGMAETLSDPLAKPSVKITD